MIRSRREEDASARGEAPKRVDDLPTARLRPEQVLALQRSAGNAAVLKLLAQRGAPPRRSMQRWIRVGPRGQETGSPRQDLQCRARARAGRGHAGRPWHRGARQARPRPRRTALPLDRQLAGPLAPESRSRSSPPRSWSPTSSIASSSRSSRWSRSRTSGDLHPAARRLVDLARHRDLNTSETTSAPPNSSACSRASPRSRSQRSSRPTSSTHRSASHQHSAARC
jgi:hypothetical protein